MVGMESYSSTSPGSSRYVKAKEALDWTWREWKKRSNPYMMASVESYLIMLVFSFIYIFLLIGAIVLLIVIGGALAGAGGSASLIFILTGSIVVFLVIFLLFTVAQSIIASGMMNAIDRTFNGSVYKFGDVFRYGKSSISKYLMIVILNGIFRMVILFVSFLIPISIMVLTSIALPEMFCFGFLLFFLMIIPVVIFVVAPISVQPYLSFIIRYNDKEGRMTSLDCVLKAYSIIGKNYNFCRNMGLWVMLFSFLIGLIPTVGNLIVGIFRFPFVSTAMLYSYYEMVDPSNRPVYDNRKDTSQRREEDQFVGGPDTEQGFQTEPGMKRCSKCTTLVRDTETICPNCYSNIM